MSGNRKALQNGFTAVELLITLIIASIFLFAGYQLYTQVTRSSTDANKSALVSNKAYEKMRVKALDPSVGQATSCTAIAPSSTTEAVAGVGNVTFITEVKCPNAAAALDLYQIKVTANYTDAGLPKTVEQSSYVN